jgi:hypothetical protein
MTLTSLRFSKMLVASRLTWRLFTDQRSQANIAMGIRKSPNDKDPALAAFTEDILKIEIFGPEAGFVTLIKKATETDFDRKAI